MKMRHLLVRIVLSYPEENIIFDMHDLCGTEQLIGSPVPFDTSQIVGVRDWIRADVHIRINSNGS